MAKNEKLERLHFMQNINIISKVPTKYGLHWHGFTEILFCPQDMPETEIPRIEVDQKTYDLGPGDVLMIWASEMHSVEYNTEATGLKGLQFPTTLLTDLPEFASYAHLFRNYHLITKKNPATERLAAYMHDKLHEITALRQEDGSFHGIQELICLYQLFMRFGEYLENNMLPREFMEKQGNTRTIDKINAACRYITEYCDKDLTLDLVAEQTGFSSCYFSRIFKQVTQCNFVEYLTKQRLKHAQALLADSDIPITSVAMESGFKSISTFNRVFQKYKGCSPSDYKKHYLNS